MHKTAPILLLGSYGRGNVGDDVFLLAALNLFGDRKIYINSANDNALPAEVRGKLTTISTSMSKGLLSKVRMFVTVKSIVYWGGDVWVKWYENKWQTQPLYQMLIVNAVARLCGKQVYYVGCGIGQLNGYSLWLARLSARLANTIVVRETRSADILRLSHVRTLPDLAVNLPYLEPAAHEKPRADDVYNIGISILYHIPNPERSFDKMINELTAGLSKISNKNAVITLIPMLVSDKTHNDDLWASKQLLRLLRKARINANIYQPDSLEDAVNELNKCHIVIGARLHTNILSTLCGTPCIGIAYRPKVASFFEDNGIGSYCLQLNGLDSLSKVTGHMIDNYSSVVEEFRSVCLRNLSERESYQRLAKEIR